MLEIDNLHAFYGKSHVLQGATMQVGKGEIVGLLGRNGVGRSTLVKAVIGQVAARGSVRFCGQELLGLRPHVICRSGLGYVPEDRAIFPDLSVEENLRLGEKSGRRGSRWSREDIYETFPRLFERRAASAGVLSGGEQQMLTLSRTLLGDPDLVLIDEPTEGLAPMFVERVREFLLTVRAKGTSIVLVEQKLDIVLDISDRVYVMGRGAIVFEGLPRDLTKADHIRREWLEV
jgi:branched-chain amino acid transport system ATP-binding protein